MRIALLGAMAAALMVGAVPTAGQNPDTPNAVPAQFVVRPDPRLCPSPVCGGYWVSLANHARTQCVGLRGSPRCYVAQAVDRQHRALTGGIPDGAVVRGHLEPSAYGGSSESLGAIIVSDVRVPVGSFTKGTYYRVRDVGVRCVRAPCFSYRATVLNGTWRVAISTLDLAPTHAAPRELSKAEAALARKDGLFVLGRVTTTSVRGRALHVSRFYLRARSPRA
jgi:hypothetical protein